MIEFKTREERDATENHLFWMYHVTSEIELHINSVLLLDQLIRENSLHGDLTMHMTFYHNELALLRTASILKNKPGDDEKHSLRGLENFLNGQKVKVSPKLSETFGKIELFYEKHQPDIDKLIEKRNAEAHEFKQVKEIGISINSSISLDRQLEIVVEAREIVRELFFNLFSQDMPTALKYPSDLYGKIYKHSIDIIASAVESNNN